MEKATMIIRRSVNTFLYSYHTFSSIAALLVLPVSVSILLSQALISSSSSSSSSPLLLLTITSRIQSLFDAAGFPSSSLLFSFLNTKLSETSFSFVFAFPSSITFLVLAKASVVLTIFEFPRHKVAPPPLSSLLRIYRPVLGTFLLSSLIFISINAAIFSLLFLAFSLVNFLGFSSNNSVFGLSAFGAILYSVILAFTIVICNLAIIVSAVENSSCFLSVLKACMIIRGRISTALILALFSNLMMAAVEALFQYRVIRPYHLNRKFNLALVGEGFSIIYMHSILIVLDVILTCMFYKSCKSGEQPNWDRDDHHHIELEAEEKGEFQV
ncbi:hypothetical protein J5N97_008475 [Dioscorea zingiberensis]|uniref:Transmembrane protein n=1 Tax=Dioscorea zingiberensis TaxID=325984 RepID=A0A9D5HKR0_9LILI|nr:hypothetical protein J5N97_008475 [Dioscorea zingiberensis]